MFRRGVVAAVLAVAAAVVLAAGLGGCEGPGPARASGSAVESDGRPAPPQAAQFRDSNTPQAADFRGPNVKSPAEYLREPQYAQADLQRGELLSLACKACHALEPGEQNDKAPELYGVIGRRAGSRGDFEYSDALRNSGIVWSPAALSAWLTSPQDLVPGTKMKFTGFQSAEDRRDVIAYLLRHLGSAPPRR